MSNYIHLACLTLACWTFAIVCVTTASETEMSNLFACSTLSTDIFLNIWDLTRQAKMCKYIMQIIILPAVDPGIRYERCKTKIITVCVKDVLYVIALVLAMSTRGLYGFTYWSGLIWSGLVWSGLVWSGLVWSPLTSSDLIWPHARLVSSQLANIRASEAISLDQ